MDENILYLHGKPPAIAYYTRVGFNDHCQIEQLISAGKMTGRRFVLEAGNFERQSELIRTLRDENAEIVLDTNAAELSVPGKFAGASKNAEWAEKGQPLELECFRPGTNRSIIEPIARFAVENGLSSVMAPCHYLGGDQRDVWYDLDRAACVALRETLDRVGGENIAIDYPLMVAYQQLRDPTLLSQMVSKLKDIPFDYLWLRVSGFGANATAAGLERYIKALINFNQLKRPIILDQVGGLASLAACSFGVASGFSHGIAGKERFAAESWLKPPVVASKDDRGGPAKTVYIPGLDRRLKIKEARELFDNARTSREIFGCGDKSCCGDIDKLLNNPEAHFVVQKERQVHDLSRSPTSLRAKHFISSHLGHAKNQAKRATRLKKVSDESKEKINSAYKRLERMEDTLTNLAKATNRAGVVPEALERPKIARQKPKEIRGSGR